MDCPDAVSRSVARGHTIRLVHVYFEHVKLSECSECVLQGAPGEISCGSAPFTW